MIYVLTALVIDLEKLLPSKMYAYLHRMIVFSQADYNAVS